MEYMQHQILINITESLIHPGMGIILYHHYEYDDEQTILVFDGLHECQQVKKYPLMYLQTLNQATSIYYLGHEIYHH